MKKVLSLLVVLVLFAGFTNGQSKITLGVGGTLALPMGTFGDVVSMGFGGLVKGEMGFGSMIGTASVGYVTFSGKDVAGYKSSWSAIPILVGTKYSFASSFYGSVEAGLNMVTVEATTPEIKSGTTVLYPSKTVSTSSTEFGYALGVGYQLSAIDIVLKYQTLASSANFIGVNVIYNFGL
ncbi:MAG: hypothetical protein COW85_11045 [Ignavibacteria bacterium CG22_combo_CG10-13_8_21_14_all_37_15]|nr:MAG: hypothetical protein COW85_11045 [Ignavibacteria bacterium CG22_combo_CG10-13_8_21_14_all_37_15]PJC57862.1 MAG: hypothetical protein CO025_11125 [Ignavibacteria bacterium CG_4_9_14_0_2_um_filter_37_13]